MREIKFRAWNGKQMIYLSEQYLDRYYMQIDNQAWGVFDKENSFGAVANSHNKNNVLMQYTGLKDKNGKEVYEGDIVECRSGETCQGFREYDNIIEVTFGFTDGMWDLLQCEEIEVIGNIYEKTELIEE